MLVGGLVAFGAYKMSTRDAKRVEEHTGVPPEEMTDAELSKAMDDLGVEKQTRAADDVEEGAAASPSTERTDLEELEKLADLHAKGVLTDDEFAAAKAKTIGI